MEALQEEHVLSILSELRPCTVNGQKALFHKWEDCANVIEPSPMINGHQGGQIKETYAIVEMEDGRILEVKPIKVKFENTSEYMALLNAELHREAK